MSIQLDKKLLVNPSLLISEQKAQSQKAEKYSKSKLKNTYSKNEIVSSELKQSFYETIWQMLIEIFGSSHVREYGEKPNKMWVDVFEDLNPIQVKNAIKGIQDGGFNFPVSSSKFKQLATESNQEAPKQAFLRFIRHEPISSATNYEKIAESNVNSKYGFDLRRMNAKESEEKYIEHYKREYKFILTCHDKNIDRMIPNNNKIEHSKIDKLVDSYISPQVDVFEGIKILKKKWKM